MNDFLFVNNWFYEKYFLKLEQGHRYWTMYQALSLLLQRGGTRIVETGCLRMKDDWGAGMSTLVFSDFAKRYKKEFYSVDLNKENLEIARVIVDETVGADIDPVYCESDSIEFLKGFNQEIDLLYLDSLDFDFNDPEPAQTHCLNELQAAYDKLSDKAIVLFDDNNLPGGGKPATAKMWLQEQGWTCILDHHQSLWIRN